MPSLRLFYSPGNEFKINKLVNKSRKSLRQRFQSFEGQKFGFLGIKFEIYRGFIVSPQWLVGDTNIM